MRCTLDQAAIFCELLEEDPEVMDDYQDPVSDFQRFVTIMREAGQRSMVKEMRRLLACQL